MKKVILWFMPLILLLSCTACQKDYAFQKDSFYINLAEHTDLAFPELSFHSASELNDDTRYLFFQLMMHTNSLYQNGEKFKTENGYEIPISSIKETLKTYLGSSQFDPQQLSDATLYDQDKKSIVIKALPAFGGNRHVKLTNKKYLGGDKVTFTTKVYDEDNQYLYQKTITIRQGEGEKAYCILEIETDK